MTHYDTLGVDRNASDNTIKESWKKLVKENHPDLTGGDDAKIKQINEAYNTLKNSATRSQYDREQLRPEDGVRFTHSMSDDEMDDIFSQFAHAFGAQGGTYQRQRHNRKQNRNLNINLSISLEDLVQDDSKKHISVKLSNGEREIVEIDIPAHIESGQRIKYPNLGDNAYPSLTRGDLFVTIHIKKHKTFDKRGLDLHTVLTIDCFDAMLGTDKIIKTLTGKNLKVKIPKSTQFGTVLNISNEGLTLRDKTGNIYVQILVKVPDNLTANEITQLSQMRKK